MAVGGRTEPVEGERRLMIAVLAHALRSLFHDAGRPGRGAARRLRQDLRWLTSSDRDDPFAFERICEALELDTARIRDRVLLDLGICTATSTTTTATVAPFMLAAEPLMAQRIAALG